MLTSRQERGRYRNGSANFNDPTTAQWDRDLILLEKKAAEGYARKEDREFADAIYAESANRMKLTKALAKTRAMSPEEAHARIVSFKTINDRAARLRKKLWFAR